MGSLSLLQGIFPTQGLNPGLPHCRRILYQLSLQGSPSWPLERYLEGALSGLPSALPAEPPGKPLLAPRMVFGGCALRPAFAAARSGFGPWVPRLLLVAPCAALGPSAGVVCPLLPFPEPFPVVTGTLGMIAPVGGTWAAPGRWLQRVKARICVCVSLHLCVGSRRARQPLTVTSHQDLFCEPLPAGLWPGQCAVSALLTDGSKDSAVSLGCGTRAQGH